MITLYDTTLRDGTQREGMSLSVEDKLRIVCRLDDLGIRFIEGGFPASNPKDSEFFAAVRQERFSTAVVSAFGSTCRSGGRAADDPGLRALLDTGCEALCIVGKAWDLHVTETLRTTLDENLRMVRDSVAFLKAEGRTVFFDAEHFFDGYVRNAEYSVGVCRAAAEAGADGVVLCDTNGAALPFTIAEVVAFMTETLPDVTFGIHAHNDSACAVANSLMAVESGCTHVQGTINGYGERAGNADLCSIIPALVLKMDRECVSQDQLKLLTEVSHFVAETANLSPDPHQPYVGTSAFAHKGGLHASAVSRLPAAYEHVDPASVGNLARVIVSELAGRASLVMKARELGVDLETEARAAKVLDDIKRMEYGGYSFEAAGASLEILLRKEMGTYEPFFKLESFRALMEKREDGKVMTEATVKVWVGEERFIATAEGNGPVNALDGALRLAIGRFYPHLADIHLADFKVRVLDEKKGTAAVTRVLIESGDGDKSWGTVGVSENIIEASWHALVDSIEYGLAHPESGSE